MTIKLLLLGGILYAGFFAYRGAPGAASLAARRAALTITLVAAACSVIAPELVTAAAHLVGVGRGTDLVLYFFVLASVIVWIALYRRIHEIEQRFVRLNRAITLDRGPVTTQDDAQSFGS